MTDTRFTVEHRPDARTFILIDNEAAEATAIGEEAYVDLDHADARERVFFHTEVSEEYAGQGLASVLVRSAVEQTIAAGYSVVPVCPYVVQWLSKHPEYAEHVVRPTSEHRRIASS